MLESWRHAEWKITFSTFAEYQPMHCPLEIWINFNIGEFLTTTGWRNRKTKLLPFIKRWKEQRKFSDIREVWKFKGLNFLCTLFSVSCLVSFPGVSRKDGCSRWHQKLPNACRSSQREHQSLILTGRKCKNKFPCWIKLIVCLLIQRELCTCDLSFQLWGEVISLESRQYTPVLQALCVLRPEKKTLVGCYEEPAEMGSSGARIPSPCLCQ